MECDLNMHRRRWANQNQFNWQTSRIDMDVENWRFVVKCFSRNGKRNLKNIIFPHFKNC
ncbi:unnamed protein product [Sphagnum jensenii]